MRDLAHREDYYMYIGVSRVCSAAQAKARQMGLFVEEFRSPHGGPRDGRNLVPHRRSTDSRVRVWLPLVRDLKSNCNPVVGGGHRLG